MTIWIWARKREIEIERRQTSFENVVGTFMDFNMHAIFISSLNIILAGSSFISLNGFSVSFHLTTIAHTFSIYCDLYYFDSTFHILIQTIRFFTNDYYRLLPPFCVVCVGGGKNKANSIDRRSNKPISNYNNGVLVFRSSSWNRWTSTLRWRHTKWEGWRSRRVRPKFYANKWPNISHLINHETWFPSNDIAMVFTGPMIIAILFIQSRWIDYLPITLWYFMHLHWF